MLLQDHRHLYNTLFVCNSPHYCKITANLSAIHFKSLLSRAGLRLQVWMTVKAAAAVVKVKVASGSKRDRLENVKVKVKVASGSKRDHLEDVVQVVPTTTFQTSSRTKNSITSSDERANHAHSDTVGQRQDLRTCRKHAGLNKSEIEKKKI